MTLFRWEKEVKEDPSKMFATRMDKVEQELVRLKNENLDLYTTIDTLRNKVLRKIQTRKSQEEEPEPYKLETGQPMPLDWGAR